MRKFSARWWLSLPKFPKELGTHSHQRGAISVGFCMDCVLGVPTVPIEQRWTVLDELRYGLGASLPADSVRIIG
jgi:hypothetical protein